MDEIRYWKPSITNLDPDLGRSIFETIRSTPRPDREALNRHADEILQRFLDAQAKRSTDASSGGTDLRKDAI